MITEAWGHADHPCRALPGDQVGPAEVARTGKVLLLSTQPPRRAWAARCLGMSGQVAAYAWLRRALMDPDEDVRVCVVEAVGLLGVAQAAGELAALYAWSGPRVRRSVIRAAARMAGVPGWTPLLRLALDDTDGRIRAMAVRAMRVGAQRRL